MAFPKKYDITPEQASSFTVTDELMAKLKEVLPKAVGDTFRSLQNRMPIFLSRFPEGKTTRAQEEIVKGLNNVFLHRKSSQEFKGRKFPTIELMEIGALHRSRGWTLDKQEMEIAFYILLERLLPHFTGTDEFLVVSILAEVRAAFLSGWENAAPPPPQE